VYAAPIRGHRGLGAGGDQAWAAAVVLREHEVVGQAIVRGHFRAPYQPGLLALREGALLELTVREAGIMPDVLLVNATAKDHPRGAGLALHLGWAIGVPTIGITDRALHDPAASAPVALRQGARPVRVHPGWRTDLEAALEVVRRLGGSRTPTPLRVARRLARSARARDAAGRTGAPT
jgi:deoxyribonuclease V